MDLICISLMANDAEHLCQPYVLFDEVPVLVLCQLLIELFFLLLSFEIPLFKEAIYCDGKRS